MKRIGVLTSGGDAPGMNAAIRSVVRVASAEGCSVFGIRRGYRGLLDGEITPLGPRDVSNVIQRGGTILKTARSAEFKTHEGLSRAVVALERSELDGLIVIGGDGTFRGASALVESWGGAVVGIPGTIDNDLYGTDYTLGFDTAVNTALDAIDKIRDTAESHERVFLVEVMGHRSGWLAQHAGIGAGAEEIIIPEETLDPGKIAQRLTAGLERGKTSMILVVAEGDATGGAYHVAEQLSPYLNRDCRVTILGHLQRGGSPSAFDRFLGTKLGGSAVAEILNGKTGIMVGEVGSRPTATPLRDSWTLKKEMDVGLRGLHDRLAL